MRERGVFLSAAIKLKQDAKPWPSFILVINWGVSGILLFWVVKEQGEGRRSFSKSLYVVARMTRAPLLGNQRKHIYLDFQGIEWQQI